LRLALAIRFFLASDISPDPEWPPTGLEFAEPARGLIYSGGPNLGWVKDNAGDLVFRKLRRGCAVRLLMMNPKGNPAVGVLDRYEFFSNFQESLTSVVRGFQKWVREAGRDNLPLDVRLCDFLQISFHIVDPDADTGRMRLIPIPPRTSGVDRACVDVV